MGLLEKLTQEKAERDQAEAQKIAERIAAEREQDAEDRRQG